MKKLLGKVIGIVISMAMIVALLPMGVLAEETPTSSTYATFAKLVGEGANFGAGDTAKGTDVEINGNGATVNQWVDAYVHQNTTIKNVTFKNGAVFSAAADDIKVTFENCVFYACDQDQAAKDLGVKDKVSEQNNILTNTGAGMCLDLETSGKSGVTFEVVGCTSTGDGGIDVPVYGDKYEMVGGKCQVNDSYRKRGHGIALNAIKGGCNDSPTLRIEDCTIENVRGNAIQLYGTTGDITIKNTKINSWGVNSGKFTKKDDTEKDADSFAIRGDWGSNISKKITLQDVYFGLDETKTDGHQIGHIYVGDKTNVYENSTVTAGTESPKGDKAGWYFESVAKIGDNKYGTVADAITAAKTTDTITLLGDVSVSKTLVVDGTDITLDLSGKTLTGENVRAIHVEKGTLTLTGLGTVTSVSKGGLELGSSVIHVGDSESINTAYKSVADNTKATLVVDAGVTIQAPATYGISAFGENTNAEVTIKGTVTATAATNEKYDGCAVATYCKDTYTPATINIEEGADVSAEHTNAVYIPAGTLNVNGGTITGTTGIYFKAGNMTISGGTVTGNGAKQQYGYLNVGGKSTGESVTIDNCNYPEQIGTISLKGGKFTSTNADAIGSYAQDSTYEKQTSFITGGIYSSSPKAYVNEEQNVKVYKYPDSTYVVAEAAPSGYSWTAASGEATKEYDFVGTKIYSGGSSSTTTTDDVTNKTEDQTTDTAALTTATVKNTTETHTDGTKTVSAAVSTDTAKKIVENAISNKSEEVIIDTTASTSSNTAAVTETAAGTTTKVDLPEETVKAIAKNTQAAVTIKTEAAEVTLDKDAVSALADQAGDDGTVNLVVETVKQDESAVQVDLKLMTSRGAVSDFRGGNVSVTVRLNEELAAKVVACVYIDDYEKYQTVDGEKNEDDTFTFKTGHFSTYAIMEASEAEKVIADQAKQLAKLIKELGLTVKTSRTSKDNIKAKVSTDVTALTDKGYTVKYKFFRSKKQATKYKAATKIVDAAKYIDKTGTKGIRYYYKARAYVYNGDTLVGKTTLAQCAYGSRIWKK